MNLPDINCTSTSGNNQIILLINFGDETWSLDVIGSPGTIHFDNGLGGFDKRKRDNKKNFVVTNNSDSINAKYDGDDTPVDSKFTGALSKNHSKLSFTLTDKTNGLALLNGQDNDLTCEDN